MVIQHQETLGNRDDLAVTLCNIAMTYDTLEQPKRAYSYYQQALTLQLELGDKIGEANTRLRVSFSSIR